MVETELLKIERTDWDGDRHKSLIKTNESSDNDNVYMDCQECFEQIMQKTPITKEKLDRFNFYIEYNVLMLQALISNFV